MTAVDDFISSRIAATTARANGHDPELPEWLADEGPASGSGSLESTEPRPPCKGGQGGRRATQDDAVVLSTVAAERVDWLWRGRVPLGRLTLLDGDPGLGKSTVTIDLAARLTTGRPMPGATDSREPCGVVLVAPEDGLADTVRPRFAAAGGDASRVAAFRRLVTLPDDVAAIESAAARVGARLIIIDPLMAALGRATDSYRDQDCRRALGPLALLAERLGAAVLIIRHLNKGDSTDPMRRGGGSVGILGAARSALLLARDPDGDDDDRVVATYKSNLGRPSPALKLRLLGVDGTVRVDWGASTALEPHELLAPRRQGGSVGAASAWLTHQLHNGPRLARDLAREAADAGIAWTAVRRAKAAVPVTTRKQIGTGQWVWQLGKVITSPCSERLDHLDHPRDNMINMIKTTNPPRAREPGDEDDEWRAPTNS